MTYYSLASGFLTGKYRQQSDLAQSQRGSGIGKYLNPRGLRIIDTWLRSLSKTALNLPKSLWPG